MRHVPAIFLLVALLSPPAHAQRRGAAPEPSPDVAFRRVESAVRTGFGPGVKVVAAQPTYLHGDFNGDGFSDLAVLVNVEEAGAKAGLKSHGVRFLNVDPYSRQNGAPIDPLSHDSHNCLGIAVIHGTAEGWAAAAPAGKFMVYECFSSFSLHRKGRRIRRGAGSEGPTPVPKGDSIILDLETGGTALVYWNGKTYRGFGLRGGD